MKISLLVSFCLAAGSVSAGLLTLTPADIGLYNTGVDASGLKLANLEDEIHWMVTANPAATVQENTRYFSDPAANWITGGPAKTGGSIGGALFSTFQLSFDLTGYIPGQTSITGIWGTDNFGSISLNGNPPAFSLPTGDVHPNYQTPHNFVLNSGFVSGLNTLEVTLGNEGGPGAFLVKFTEVQSMAIPEPSAVLGFLTMGSLGLLFLRRRR
jgi:hypothetical protein